MRLKNQVAIVTGAAQGLGRAIVEAMLREGATVVFCDLNAEAGQATAAEIGGEFIPCDVGDSRQINALVDTVHKRHGRIDCCVNNAGIVKSADVLDLTEAEFDAVLRVNLKGPFLLSQAVARIMVAQKSGSIINMSSINALVTIPKVLSYNVSKGGLNQLTRAMAVAFADQGVRVNAIGPGSIKTPMLEQVLANDKSAREALFARTPMGRCGEPSEIASIAVFLASAESSYITGECIYADGGRMALNYTVPVTEEN